MNRVMVCVACLVCVVGGGISGEAEEYTIGIIPYYSLAPFAVADAKGFFLEEDVRVALKYYNSINDYYNAVLHHRLKLISGIWNSSHLSLGKDFVSLGVTGYEQENYRLIAKPDVTPMNFTEQKVGFTVDVFPYRWFLWNYVNHHQLKMEDVQVVTVPSEENLLKNFLVGRLKVILVSGGFAERAVNEGDGKVISASKPEQTLISLLMYRPNYQTMPKTDLKKIFRAVIRATQWLADPANEEEFVAILREQFAISPEHVNISDEENLRRTQGLLKMIPADELYQYNQTILPESYRAMKAVRSALGQPADFTAAEFVDTSVLLEVLEEMGLKEGE